mmetsp:Transcript_26527/g.76349  ORF Transcript_26527/g.76349 Transcript_26527/m.76349 type:complete len:480 (-) Transcript_26527:1895-3334(-)
MDEVLERDGDEPRLQVLQRHAPHLGLHHHPKDPHRRSHGGEEPRLVVTPDLNDFALSCHHGVGLHEGMQRGRGQGAAVGASHHRAHNRLPVDGAQRPECQAVRRQGLTEFVDVHARLHAHPLPLGVDLKDAVHPVQRNDDPLASNERRAGVHGAGAPHLLCAGDRCHDPLHRRWPPELPRVHECGLGPVRDRLAPQAGWEGQAEEEANANRHEGEGEAAAQIGHGEQLERVAEEPDGCSEERREAVQDSKILDAKLVQQVCVMKAEEHEPRPRLQDEPDNLHLEHGDKDHRQECHVCHCKHKETRCPRVPLQQKLHQWVPKEAKAVEYAHKAGEHVVRPVVRVVGERHITLLVHELRRCGQVVRHEQHADGVKEHLAPKVKGCNNPSEPHDHCLTAVGPAPPNAPPDVEVGQQRHACLHLVPGLDQKVVQPHEQDDSGICHRHVLQRCTRVLVQCLHQRKDDGGGPEARRNPRRCSRLH